MILTVLDLHRRKRPLRTLFVRIQRLKEGRILVVNALFLLYVNSFNVVRVLLTLFSIEQRPLQHLHCHLLGCLQDPALSGLVQGCTRA
jgi:hypothetical protein